MIKNIIISASLIMAIIALTAATYYSDTSYTGFGFGFLSIVFIILAGFFNNNLKG